MTATTALETTTTPTLTTGHIGLNVSDLGRSRRFYEDVFGFTTVSESNQDGRAFAFLSDGQRLVLTLWQQSTGRFAPTSPGLHHLSFQVATIADVHAFEPRLHAAGATLLHGGVVPHAEGAASGGLFFEDPDGIRLEIFSPTGASDHDAPTPGAPTCGFF